MDKRTLRALHGSVRKWIAIAEWRGRDCGCDDCPLCKLFLNDTQLSDCEGCPVRGVTGSTNCVGSPYVEWNRLFPSYWWAERAVYDEASQRAAEAEALFLIGLLPPKERERYYE